MCPQPEAGKGDSDRNKARGFCAAGAGGWPWLLSWRDVPGVWSNHPPIAVIAIVSATGNTSSSVEKSVHHPFSPAPFFAPQPSFPLPSTLPPIPGFSRAIVKDAPRDIQQLKFFDAAKLSGLDQLSTDRYNHRINSNLFGGVVSPTLEVRTPY